MDWELAFKALCQPKPYYSIISPSEFWNLTLPQLISLITSADKKEEPVNLYGSAQEWRRNTIPVKKYIELFIDRHKRLPTEQDKLEFYGVLPIGDVAG